MIEVIKKNLWNFPYLLATIGGISALVSLFINIQETISIKWLIFLALISSYSIVILIKIISDFLHGKGLLRNYETPIKFLENDNILVIRRNENFINSIMVSVYSTDDDGIEKIASLGVVHNIQEKIVQIRLFIIYDEAPFKNELKQLRIRSVIPSDILLSELTILGSKKSLPSQSPSNGEGTER